LSKVFDENDGAKFVFQKHSNSPRDRVQVDARDILQVTNRRCRKNRKLFRRKQTPKETQTISPETNAERNTNYFVENLRRKKHKLFRRNFFGLKYLLTLR
jgi:hypothetical protein